MLWYPSLSHRPTAGPGHRCGQQTLSPESKPLLRDHPTPPQSLPISGWRIVHERLTGPHVLEVPVSTPCLSTLCRPLGWVACSRQEAQQHPSPEPSWMPGASSPRPPQSRCHKTSPGQPRTRTSTLVQSSPSSLSSEPRVSIPRLTVSSGERQRARSSPPRISPVHQPPLRVASPSTCSLFPQHPTPNPHHLRLQSPLPTRPSPPPEKCATGPTLKTELLRIALNL